MLAMQYSVRLPEDFNNEQIYKHVEKRAQLFEGCPGLRHKFYLYDPEEQVYAPFYIWENYQFAQDFLLNNLFSGVVETFGRPRVRIWQVLEFDYGTAHDDPKFLYSAIDKVPSRKPLADLKREEHEHHLEMLEADGLFAHMVLLDPDRWEKGQFSLWQSREIATPEPADCIYGYEVLKNYQQMQGAA